MGAVVVISLLGAGIAIAGAVTAVVTRHALESWRGRVEALEASVAALRRELEMVASISARTGRLVQRVEQEFSGVAERIDLVESRGAAMPGSLDEAITWARRGADADKLEQQFGLTSAEAELVSRLHGVKRSA
jgi:hypothetical protein